MPHKNCTLHVRLGSGTYQSGCFKSCRLSRKQAGAEAQLASWHWRQLLQVRSLSTRICADPGPMVRFVFGSKLRAWVYLQSLRQESTLYLSFAHHPGNDGRRAAALPPVPVRRPWTVLGLKACHFRRVCNGRGKGTGHNEHRPPPHPDLVDSSSTAIPDVACLANPAAKRGNHARRLCCIIASCRSAMCQRTARHVHL